MNIPWLLMAVFWVMQVAAVVLFKYGSTAQARFIPCFIAANIIGITSTWLLMLIFKKTQANVGSALAYGVSFMLVQIALWAGFRKSMTSFQKAGIFIIVIGVFFLCWKQT